MHAKFEACKYNIFQLITFGVPKKWEKCKVEKNEKEVEKLYFQKFRGIQTI